MINIGATKPVTKDTMPILTDTAGKRFLETNWSINRPSKAVICTKRECDCNNVEKDELRELVKEEGAEDYFQRLKLDALIPCPSGSKIKFGRPHQHPR